jgi:hypothetical protein
LPSISIGTCSIGRCTWRTDQFRFKAAIFDPLGHDGPLMLNKLHLNSIHCAQGGMYLTGLKSGGMLLFNGKKVQMAAELPAGSHNAQRFATACCSTTPMPMPCGTRAAVKGAKTARSRYLATP